MIISCNECDSSFEVDDNLIKEAGSKVRCSKCNSVFVAYPQPLDSDDGDDLGLEDLDSSLAGLDDDEESFDVEGLGDELELDLDDFDDAPGAEDLSHEALRPTQKTRSQLHDPDKGRSPLGQLHPSVE